jgi:phytoene synthase
MPDARESEDLAEVRRVARQFDYNRYLAALLAPAPARDGLLAIAAFHGEISRIPVSVAEPTIAAIRLQWWRDQLDDAAWDGPPVVHALRRALGAQNIPLADAVPIVDAYEELLHPGALSTPEAVEAFTNQGQGTAVRLAARLLRATQLEPDVPLITAAAQCYGRMQLLRALPLLLQKGRDPLARDAHPDWVAIAAPLLADMRAEYAKVRRHAPSAEAAIRQSILPVALVGPYLKALEGLGPNIAFEQATISPLTRVWRIYAAKRLRRF